MDIYELPDVTTALQSGDVLVLCREVSPGVWTTYQIDAVNLNGQNLSNTDLTFTGNRTHDLDGSYMQLSNGFVVFDNNDTTAPTAVFNSDAGGTTNATGVVSIVNANNTKVALHTEGVNKFDALPVYADEAAAVTGGLLTGMVYQTATGELRIKL